MDVLIGNLLFAAFFIPVLVSFGFYEALVKRQHAIAPDAWEADGRPTGFFWQASGTSPMGSWARGRALWRWTFSTPDWLAADSKALAAQRGMRISCVVAQVAWLVAVMVEFGPWNPSR